MKSLVLIVLILVSYALSAENEAIKFPDQAQRQVLANALLTGIEKLDAVTIEVRNNTRKVKWDKFKALTINNVSSATNWNQLYQAINKVHYGILNKHSYVLVQKNITNNVTQFQRWPKYQVGYTWPKISFFSIQDQKGIQAINGQDIHTLFDEFFNLYCNDAHKTGCLRSFVNHLKAGYSFLDMQDKLVITFTDGREEVVAPYKPTNVSQSDSVECQNLYPSLDANLIYKGNQSCLYEIDSKYLLKIFLFDTWGTNYNDIYCENVSSIGMCKDIKEISRITQSTPKRPLIIDLQNNKGGSENTPWIAALTQSGFKDNLVMYKNIQALSDSEIRESAFYFSERAENWYQSLNHEVEKTNKFLPIRADFCRGSKSCKPSKINSSASIPYSEIRLVTNEKCVSSCDDLVWRLRQYAQAKTYGQLPATDGAYARLKGHIYLTKNGNIKNEIVGENTRPSTDKGQLLVAYQIPISKTVNQSGKTLDGKDFGMDFPNQIGMHNFLNLRESNVMKALAQ